MFKTPRPGWKGLPRAEVAAIGNFIAKDKAILGAVVVPVTVCAPVAAGDAMVL